MESPNWTQVNWKEAYVHARRTVFTSSSRFRLVARTGLTLTPGTRVYAYQDKFYLVLGKVIRELSVDGVVTRQAELRSKFINRTTTSLPGKIYLAEGGLGFSGMFYFSLDSWTEETEDEYAGSGPSPYFVLVCGCNKFRSKNSTDWECISGPVSGPPSGVSMLAAVMRDERMYICLNSGAGLDIFVMY